MATVIDASVVIQMLDFHITDELLNKRLSKRKLLHAPELLDAEVLSAVRGLLIGGKITLARAVRMLDQFAAMHHIVRHPARPFINRVLELAHSFTAYDALYVALAEKLRAPLFTRDAKFERASGHKADIHVYP